MMQSRSEVADALPLANDDASIGIVIPCFNQAAFLSDALDSLLAQTHPPAQIVVVDDGSRDHPEQVVARYPGVELISQPNAGLSAARNTGLTAIRTRYVTFLDADDLLCPRALEFNRAFAAAHPDAGFVYGAYQRVDGNRQWLSGPHFRPVAADAWRNLLEGNPVGMVATVLFDTARLRAVGGFVAGLSPCEDYDAYLRLARHYPAYAHPECVALYRIHGANQSANVPWMLEGALRVLDRHRPDPHEPAAMASWRQGRRAWRRLYGEKMAFKTKGLPRASATARLVRGMALSPRAVSQRIARGLARRWHRITGSQRSHFLPLGHVDMGQLANLEPVSRSFGYDRGTPLDRHYIERFLVRHSRDIRGRALEVGDASYCERLGRGITVQDVLHVSPDAPGATIAGDLASPGLLPADTFDCEVICQTLHLLIDVRAGIEELYRALRPGGVLLATVPGISPIDHGEWKDTWYWSMTAQSASRLFGAIFGADNVDVTVNGNVYAATCFLQGMALEEVHRPWLDHTDPAYPVTIAIRAVKRA